MADFTGQMEGFASVLGTQPRRILLDADTGDVVAGGNGAGGDIRAHDADNRLRIRIDALGAEGGSGPMQSQVVPILLRGDGAIRAGGSDTNGSLTLLDSEGKTRAKLAADSSDLVLSTPAGNASVYLRASEEAIAGLWLGAAERNGLVVLRDAAGTNRASLSSESGRLNLHDEKGNLVLTLAAQAQDDRAGMWVGGEGRDGVVVARNAAGANRVVLDADNGVVRVCNDNGDTAIRLRGDGASGWFGGHGQAGDVLLFAANVDDPGTDNASIWLQGNNGDIVLRNADCAEEFTVRPEAGIEPGSVLVLDEDGRLALCAKEYDSRVAGVVSGADGVRPGIVLGRVPGATDRRPIALAGKVVCNVDASFGPIRVGSLLTTSPRAGFAMVAADRERAFGAVIGKAMAPLSAATGKVPVLVCLQ
jgi:hypothetical protein